MCRCALSGATLSGVNAWQGAVLKMVPLAALGGKRQSTHPTMVSVADLVMR